METLEKIEHLFYFVLLEYRKFWTIRYSLTHLENNSADNVGWKVSTILHSVIGRGWGKNWALHFVHIWSGNVLEKKYYMTHLQRGAPFLRLQRICVQLLGLSDRSLSIYRKLLVLDHAGCSFKLLAWWTKLSCTMRLLELCCRGSLCGFFFKLRFLAWYIAKPCLCRFRHKTTVVPTWLFKTNHPKIMSLAKHEIGKEQHTHWYK